MSHDLATSQIHTQTHTRYTSTKLYNMHTLAPVSTVTRPVGTGLDAFSSHSPIGFFAIRQPWRLKHLYKCLYFLLLTLANTLITCRVFHSFHRVFIVFDVIHFIIDCSCCCLKWSSLNLAAVCLLSWCSEGGMGEEPNSEQWQGPPQARGAGCLRVMFSLSNGVVEKQC